MWFEHGPIVNLSTKPRRCIAECTQQKHLIYLTTRPIDIMDDMKPNENAPYKVECDVWNTRKSIVIHSFSLNTFSK